MDQGLILKIQKNELTEHVIYQRLAGLVKNDQHRKLLERISQEEKKHYYIFKELSGKESAPDRLKAGWFVFISRFLGLNFGLKLMESGEAGAQETYNGLKAEFSQIEAIIRDEEKHEQEIISLIEEERLKYVSSMVLGLNDALVELTGALAGFTLALNNTRLIGTIGLITGLAAAMSMASSEYLSTKHEETDKDPFKASVYTGIAYVVTVILLILPYFLINNLFISLGLTIFIGLTIMCIFTFYVSVAKGLPFRKRFLEMAGLSLSIAAISFLIGLVVKTVFNIDI